MNRPDPKVVLAGLKDFQARTVDYVFDRMYGDNPTRRFLVADEVGLGKTLVARGVIAKAIDHLWDSVDRIDIVYICSNADIARQNIRRLNVTSDRAFAFEQRLTLLTTQLGGLTKNKVNFVAFTPGTSFDVAGAEGRVEERALLFCLLRTVLGNNALTIDRQGDVRVFQGSVRDIESMRYQIRKAQRPADQIDPLILKAFRAALKDSNREARSRREPSMQERLRTLRATWSRRSGNPSQEDRRDRRLFIGDLRSLLARAVIGALEPDLVILDEFQRFKSLLEGETDASVLAHALFDFSGDDAHARTLLLSATPYKMYTLADESDTDDHYADFVRTVDFLMNGDTATFANHLRHFRQALLTLGPGEPGTEALKAKRRVEKSLRTVMCRTERLSPSYDRNGMLSEVAAPASLTKQDALAYVELHSLAEALQSGTHVEYWKSSPYFVNLMDGYQLGRAFERTLAQGEHADEVRATLAQYHGLIDWQAHRTFRPLDPGNARMRALQADTTGADTWKLLWIPPSLPYTEAGPPFDAVAPFTKRLVFSAWNAVPRAIATLMSYDAERRMMKGAHHNTPEARAKVAELLRFTRYRGRLQGMPVLATIYPSPALATLADPLRIMAAAGGQAMSIGELRHEVIRRLQPAMAPFAAAAEDGRTDDRWYWAMPLLLDQAAGYSDWILSDANTAWWTGSDGSRSNDGFRRHVELARSLLQGDIELGPQPDDLANMVADIAIGGPGTAGLRALSRVFGDDALTNDAARSGAARTGYEFRNLFNLPEVRRLVGQFIQPREPYWQAMLAYNINGNLQSVLDEYAHVLRDWLGVVGAADDAAIRDVADALASAVSTRSVDYELRDPMAAWEDGKRRMRSRFALPFGQRTVEEGQIQRSADVRAAFNSPFWPFVLASTSVGQEGLDFHTYCHAVVHWNIPQNPVDLEQREGRVHRYKGHAIRKNVAAAHRSAVADRHDGDPWDAMFQAATEARPKGHDDLVPFWIYPGDAKIERHVPAVPLSREIGKLSDLKRTLTLYRLVFGQPRQEDLLELLLSRGLDEKNASNMVAQLRVDLSPRGPRVEASGSRR